MPEIGDGRDALTTRWVSQGRSSQGMENRQSADRGEDARIPPTPVLPGGLKTAPAHGPGRITTEGAERSCLSMI